jgi:hypothetical protein
MDFLKKEAPEIKATVMSMFFRSRSPRTLRTKSAGKTPHKALHQAPVPMLDLGASPVPVAPPGPRVDPRPVHPPKRRRAFGYRTTGAPGPRIFRVT